MKPLDSSSLASSSSFCCSSVSSGCSTDRAVPSRVNCGAPAITWASVSSLSMPENALGSMDSCEASKPSMADPRSTPDRSMPWPKPESALVSNEKAASQRLLVDAEHRLEVKLVLLVVLQLLEGLAREDVHVSGLACCSRTICASCAASIR